MKKLNYLTFVIIAAFLSACSTSNDVASNKLIQKRKYNKGFHLAGLQRKAKIIDTNADIVDVEKSTTNTLGNKPALQEMETTIFNDIKLSASTNVGLDESDLNQQVEEFVAVASNVLSEKQFSKIQKKVAKLDNKIQRKANTNQSSSDDDKLLYILIAILIPFVAVGLVTDWDVKDVLINLLLCFLCYIPGLIHAIMKINDNM